MCVSYKLVVRVLPSSRFVFCSALVLCRTGHEPVDYPQHLWILSTGAARCVGVTPYYTQVRPLLCYKRSFFWHRKGWLLLKRHCGEKSITWPLKSASTLIWQVEHASLVPEYIEDWVTLLTLLLFIHLWCFIMTFICHSFTHMMCIWEVEWVSASKIIIIAAY